MWQSSLSDSRQSKFGWNLAGGSTEISDFVADVNSRAPLNCSVFTRQVQLGRSTKSGGITVSCTDGSDEWVKCSALADIGTAGVPRSATALRVAQL